MNQRGVNELLRQVVGLTRQAQAFVAASGTASGPVVLNRSGVIGAEFLPVEVTAPLATLTRQQRDRDEEAEMEQEQRTGRRTEMDRRGCTGRGSTR